MESAMETDKSDKVSLVLLLRGCRHEMNFQSGKYETLFWLKQEAGILTCDKLSSLSLHNANWISLKQNFLLMIQVQSETNQFSVPDGFELQKHEEGGNWYEFKICCDYIMTHCEMRIIIWRYYCTEIWWNVCKLSIFLNLIILNLQVRIYTFTHLVE